MKRIVPIALVLAMVVPALCAAETWEEYGTLRKQAEEPKLIPKGGLQPDLIPKDVIIRRINQGQPVELSSRSILFEYGFRLLITHSTYPPRTDKLRHLPRACERLRLTPVSGHQAKTAPRKPLMRRTLAYRSSLGCSLFSPSACWQFHIDAAQNRSK